MANRKAFSNLDIKDSELGVYIELSKIPNSDKSMSPMEIWSNESQERYVIAIHKDNKESKWSEGSNFQ